MLLLGGLLLASGCAIHKVQVISDPAGATVSWGDKDKGPAPTPVVTLWFPYRWYFYNISTIEVSAPGYRSTRVRVGRDMFWRILADYVFFIVPERDPDPDRWIRWGHFRRMVGIDPRVTHRTQLIRAHGRAGTWDPEDAQRLSR